MAQFSKNYFHFELQPKFVFKKVSEHHSKRFAFVSSAGTVVCIDEWEMGTLLIGNLDGLIFLYLVIEALNSTVSLCHHLE